MRNFSFLFFALVFCNKASIAPITSIKRGFNDYHHTIHQDYEKRQRISDEQHNSQPRFRRSVKRSYDNMLGCWNGYTDPNVERFCEKRFRQNNMNRELVRSRFQYPDTPPIYPTINFPYNSCTDIVPYEGYYDYSYYTLEPEVIVDYEDSDDYSLMEIVEEDSYSPINDID